MKLSRALLIAAASGGVLALAATGAAGAAGGTVSTTPASFTPWLLKNVPNQRVEQLVQCGNTVFAVGTISQVGQGKNTYLRNNTLSFSATTGLVTSWSPNINGPVRSVALSPDCLTAYLGGSFTTVNGVAAKNIVAVDAATGVMKTGFAHSATNVVDTMQYTHGAVLAGGRFTSINGAFRSYFASLNPTTGAATTYANLAISGTYPQAGTQIYNSQLNHAGTRLLVEGVFTSIGGVARQQVAVLDLGASSVTVDNWFATELNRQCVPSESFYARAANWSPDDATIYIATTGYKPASGLGSKNSDPRSGLCDAAAAFPSTSANVSSKWINYTGCDSYYSVAADGNNVYVSGHERWANNPNGCDFAGPGALARPGIASIDPVTGRATSWSPTRSLGY